MARQLRTRPEVQTEQGYWSIKRKRDLNHPHRREVTIMFEGFDEMDPETSCFTVMLWPTGTKGEATGERQVVGLQNAIEVGKQAFMGECRLGPVTEMFSAKDFCSAELYSRFPTPVSTTEPQPTRFDQEWAEWRYNL